MTSTRLQCSVVKLLPSAPRNCSVACQACNIMWVYNFESQSNHPSWAASRTLLPGAFRNKGPFASVSAVAFGDDLSILLEINSPPNHAGR
mmetsp:Transcript_7482/g.14272  ORF Transcript_7482/g.14272 Transcript_7482/m.14272 type:complete len:90 (-) Transcript_7482:335-604(-)